MLPLIRDYWTRFLPSYASVLVYMLQASEYRPSAYLEWFFRTTDFRQVAKRRQLDMTRKAQLLLVVMAFLVAIVTTAVGWSALIAPAGYLGILLAVAFWLIGPYVLAFGILVPLLAGYVLIQLPAERRLIAKATSVLRDHPATRVAIVGSFGKTTAKEMLMTVLSESISAAATPGNMNTPIGISRFAAKLHGNESVLIFEYGEEKPGDVQKLARLTRPDYAIVTGINEAHLSSFGTLQNTAATIFEIEHFVPADRLYKNAESALVKTYKHKGNLWFDRKGVAGWKVSKIDSTLGGTDFTLSKGKQSIAIHTGLVGPHTVGVTAAVAVLAMELGLTPEQVRQGMAKVVPFEHRMSPRPLHGAWIIDDTYNGNSEGVAAGLSFLKTVTAKRRIYVTPGLVETGEKTEEVHVQIGKQIAASSDVVYLMKNSVTPYIKVGLKKARFSGVLHEIDDPLKFYQSMQHWVAAGDVVLMQNDWTDNYQ